MTIMVGIRTQHTTITCLGRQQSRTRRAMPAYHSGTLGDDHRGLVLTQRTGDSRVHAVAFWLA